MKILAVQADEKLIVEQACKDANIALTLAVLSIYASTIPLLGIVTALVAERLAYLTPNVEGLKTVTTKKNLVHYLTPFTFVLSVLLCIVYYRAYSYGWSSV